MDANLPQVTATCVVSSNLLMGATDLLNSNTKVQKVRISSQGNPSIAVGGGGLTLSPSKNIAGGEELCTTMVYKANLG